MTVVAVAVLSLTALTAGLVVFTVIYANGMWVA